MADELDDVTDDETAESSGAQIAVHWREEGTYPPPASFTAQANASDPAIREQFTEDKFPDCFTAYADLLTWFKPWDTVLDTSNAPFWKWFVGGELNASYNCVDRHLATHPNKAALIWVPEPESEAHQAITYRELYVRVNEFAAVLKDLGLQGGRPDHVPHADGPRTAGRDAGRGPARHRPLAGVRRLLRHGGRAPDRRLRLHRARHDGRLLPQRRPARPQGQGGRGRRGGRQGRPAGRQGSGLPPLPGQVLRRHPDGRGAGLLRRRPARRAQGRDRRAGVAAGDGPAVPDVHQRHHRPPEGLPALHRRLPRPTWPARRSTTRTSTRTTRTGAWPTSAGSPATPTSSTARSPSAPRASSTRARRTTRTPPARGGSPSSSA